MSRVRTWARGWLDLIDSRLQVFLFFLMGIGLVVSTVLLVANMITGDNWVTTCGIMFGSNAIGGGLSQIGRSRHAENGMARPLQ